MRIRLRYKCERCQELFFEDFPVNNLTESLALQTSKNALVTKIIRSGKSFVSHECGYRDGDDEAESRRIINCGVGTFSGFDIYE
jgi:hypothetical protein